MRTVFLDAGGVLFNNVGAESGFVAAIAERYQADQHVLGAELFAAAHRYETGAENVHDVIADVLGALDRSAHVDTARLDRMYLRSVRVHEPVLRAVRAIQRWEVAVVLANNEAEHWDRLKDTRFGHLGLVDEVCSSWKVGHVKPSAEFFAAVMSACPGATSTMLFVDDRPSVLAVAADLGMRTLHAADPAELPARLACALGGGASSNGEYE
ncbi:MAG TPA: HAD family hydrolase [Streptosporangiaceae bacterium]|nr:HAD family hydrolase [Streptosporangiaceae bacterium]